VVEKLSLGIAVLLLVVYLLHLLFSLWTHSFTYRTDQAAHTEAPKWSLKAAVIVLVVAVVLVALCAEAFVASLDQMIHEGSMPLSEMFLGVVVVAVVGNAAEGSVAVMAAAKNKMELAFQVAMSSAIQIALLVAPILVVASFLFASTPLTLAFSPLELLALWGGVLIAAFTLQDGESNWFEGAMLLAVYAAFAMAFWFHP
jgi:Ca2+:H+ antiporter